MDQLVIKGGRVIDPASGFDQTTDIHVADGKIVSIAADIAAGDSRIVDAAGCLVVPGLVDFHTHIYWGGTLLGVNPDKIGARTGVTTWVDCGSSGAATFEGFDLHVIQRSRMRILPFLNLSYIGLTAAGNLSLEVGELFDWRFADLGEMRRIRDTYAGRIAGIKLRASNNACAANGPIVLPLAREAADMFGVPLMVHVGVAPPTLDEVLPYLHEGDILTHIYNPQPGGCVLDANRRLKPVIKDAMDRGVKMDVGHGGASFSFAVAEAAMDQGLLPDAISTDLHAHNIAGPVVDLPHVMAKFRALGMSLSDILLRTTAQPADLLNRGDLGRLAVGGEADIALFKIDTTPAALIDFHKTVRMGEELLRNVLTIRAGEIVTPFDDGRAEARDYA